MQNRERRAQVFGTLWGKVALASLVVGICTQAWQMGMQRAFLPLYERGYITTLKGLYPNEADTSARAYDAFQAAAAMDAQLPKDARILTNPAEAPNGPDIYYSDHQLIAANPFCYAVYGGDLHKCVAAVPALEAIFGSKDAWHPLLDSPEKRSASAFNDTCRSVGANAALVTSQDSVWNEPHSWVWTMPPLYANRSRRVFRCPEEVPTVNAVPAR